jgi:SpoVK/Ycf46/Vps4 family AAA+-type ATPase
VRELEALASRITPERSWDDLVLSAGCMADLRALAAQVGHRAKVHRDWGYRRILGRATGISALFAGPSGVGKTMAAEVIAQELSLELFTVDLSRVTSKYIGETEKNLARIFDAAEAGGCVLFFDEADALFGKRSEVKDSHDRYANADVSFLLQRMESFGGLAILATNLKSHLDTAFLRRIRVIVDFAVPDVAARQALWRRALPETAPQSVIDHAALARHELTGGNITTIAANAAFRAIDEGGAITMAHLHAAMAAEFRKLDRDTSGLGGGGR